MFRNIYILFILFSRICANMSLWQQNLILRNPKVKFSNDSQDVWKGGEGLSEYKKILIAVGHEGTKICGIGKLDCMIEAEEIFELGDLRSKMNKTMNRSLKKNGYKEPPVCDCMPLCSDLSYEVDTSQSKWDWIQVVKAEAKNHSISYGKDEKYVSKLILFFKSSQFITSQRHELYGPTDFLANFGGLLGLFTGFSILSLMEAIYFLTVRLCCNSRLYGYWAGPENN